MLRNLIVEKKSLVHRQLVPKTADFVENAYISESSDEEIQPQSVVWEDNNDINNKEKIDDLVNEMYDWRRETKKGRKSRDNFRNFLFSYL